MDCTLNITALDPDEAAVSLQIFELPVTLEEISEPLNTQLWEKSRNTPRFAVAAIDEFWDGHGPEAALADVRLKFYLEGQTYEVPLDKHNKDALINAIYEAQQ